MVQDKRNTSLCMEYFCSEKDAIWNTNDKELLRLAMEELKKLKLISKTSLTDGFVMRFAEAYPVYTLDYAKNVSVLKEYLGRFENFQAIGRGGLFQYNNSDHALLSGIYAAQKLSPDTGRYDCWNNSATDSYIG